MTQTTLATRVLHVLRRPEVLGGLALLVILVAVTRGRHDTLHELGEARRLATDLRIQLNKASDASVRAVMADTDETSIAFAREAEQAKLAAKRDTDTLAPLIRGLGYTKEVQLLEEVSRRFAEYQAFDRSILELAVENTNLKAQKLSFGPARAAAATFSASLDTLTQTAPPESRCQVQSLVASAVLAVREVQVLHAPHIAESDDAAMTTMEKQMSELLASAERELSTLSNFVDPSARGQLTSAVKTLDNFKVIHTQIIALSRRNSNVRSLEMVLGKGRILTAACDASIGALQDALAKQGTNPTR